MHNKSNALESSPNHPSPSLVHGKIVFLQTGPWCQKVWGLQWHHLWWTLSRSYNFLAFASPNSSRKRKTQRNPNSDGSKDFSWKIVGCTATKGPKTQSQQEEPKSQKQKEAPGTRRGKSLCREDKHGSQMLGNTLKRPVTTKEKKIQLKFGHRI